jgi:ABC-type transporter Mla subunit MlaD
MQDLTPQLRTRLSRMERAVGWFVLVATALLVCGFVYYVYATAQRKGWFKTRAPYFTFVDRATGLKEGDPVMLMGFEAGRITRILPQPPEDFYHHVYVEFEIVEPNYGYLWTEGSRVRVLANFLGKRVLEVTKGTNGYPIYMFAPLREMTLAEAEKLESPQRWLLGGDIYDATETNRVLKALTPLTGDTLTKLRELGHERFPVFDSREQRKSPTAVWDDPGGTYVKFIREHNPKAQQKANIYWLLADETPDLNERLEKLVSQVEKALPDVLTLTNQLAAVLDQAAGAASNLHALLLEARPAATNLAALSAQLRGQGALGEWLLGPEGARPLQATFEQAQRALQNADTNLTALAENLARSLDHLAGITSNLHAQVQANTNILSDISAAIVHADELVQGLKRHWLLRSAFKSPRTNAPPPSPPDLRAPKFRDGP